MFLCETDLPWQLNTNAAERKMSEPLPPITLPPAQNPQQEGEWLKVLQRWLDEQFLLSRLINKLLSELPRFCPAADGR